MGVDPLSSDRREIFVKSGFSHFANGLKRNAVAEPSTLNRQREVGPLGYSSIPEDGTARAFSISISI